MPVHNTTSGARRRHWRILWAVAVAVFFAGAAGLPGASAVAGQPSTPTNIRVSSDHFVDHLEPSVAADPAHPENLLASAELSGPGQIQIGTFYSLDGGLHWHSNGPLPSPSVGFNATVAFDGAGTGYVAAGSPGGISVWRTSNEGRTFSAPIVIAGSGDADHPWLTTGPGTSPRSSIVYVVWKSARGLAFSRSLDSGHSFTPPRVIAAPTGGVAIPTATASPEGGLYVSYIAEHQHLRATPNYLATMVMASLDQGRTFTRPRLAALVPGALSDPAEVPITWCPALSASGGPKVTIVYDAFAADARHPDIWVRQSANGGRDWSTPLKITDSAKTNSIYFAPSVVIEPSGATDVTYLADTGNHVRLFLARIDASHRATGPVSDQAFVPPPTNAAGKAKAQGLTHPWFLGDYQGLTQNRRALFAVWADGRTGHLQLESASISAL
jgi:hypothetical protein